MSRSTSSGPLPTVVLGTKNADKLRELQGLMKGARVRVLSLKDFPACRDVVEDKRTFAANAAKKARAYSRHTRYLTLADDSGLMVSTLNGKPGVYSARFAGKGCTYQDNNRKLLSLLEGLPIARRKAKFVCVIAVYHNGRRVGQVRGECVGTIARQARGSHGFGYDPVFLPHGFKETYAELGPKIKNRISHRAKALLAAKKVLLKYLFS